MLSKIVDVVKDVTELNLRYTSTLLYLGKDYIKDINTLVSTKASTKQPPQSTRPSPLLIAGTLGEDATAAFPLANSSGRDVNVTLVAQGELDTGHVRLEPPTLAIRAGETAIVRVIAHIDAKLSIDRDYAGAVAAPGLSAQIIEFIVRRLPDPPDATGETKEAPARSAHRRTTARE